MVQGIFTLLPSLNSHSVLVFGMDHVNNLKLKDLRVLLRYHFGSEKLKGIPKKLEHVEAVQYFSERIGTVLCREEGVGCLL